MAAWADPDYALKVTGKTVSEAQLEAAQAVVDLFSNRTIEDEANLSRRDLGWLKQATAWQAAWMLEQPGFAARSSVTAVDQDLDRTQFVDDRAVSLAPLARRAIRNLSWKRSRTTHVRQPGVGPDPLLANPDRWLSEQSDDTHPWEAM